jgi:hypothetical protein
MKFHLDLKTKPAPFELQCLDPIVFEGSCFSEHLYERFNTYNLPVFSNLFGNIYHPLAINQILRFVLTQIEIPVVSFVKRDSNRYCSFFTHGQIYASDPQALQNILRQRQDNYLQVLLKSKALFITWGSAWVYQHKQHNFICANCHKRPASDFYKQISDVHDVVLSSSEIITLLRNINPDLKIIFTVSPVKHLRDGIHENVLSKSVLHVALHMLIQKHPDIYYFPSFEWIQEDLRDYRFYKADLAHPNSQAIDYVWNKFITTFYNKDQQLLFDVLEDYTTFQNHISKDRSAADFQHQQNLLKKIKSMAPNWMPNAH